MADAAVEYQNVCLRFSETERNVIDSVSFTVDRGKFVSIIGPSGCGKSTLLNLCAGLLSPTSGEVRVNENRVAGVNTQAGYVTQDANLLPWMSVFDNIALSLKIRGVPKPERMSLVEEWIERVGLGGYAFHYPSELSGGMQKRCSIARTLVYDPDVVLMDEPFGPLDAMTRMKLQQELLDLWEENRKTFIFVTHDLGEAIALSDEVVVMTGRPGQVKGVVQVPIPRPREIGALSEDEGYGRLSRELWQFFKAEIAFVENSSIVVS